MTATSFDTLKAIHDLEAAGVERRQAEAHAAALREAAMADHADFAARTGITVLQSGVTVLRSDVTSLRSDITALRAEMRWALGSLSALVLAMAAKLFGLL